MVRESSDEEGWQRSSARWGTCDWAAAANDARARVTDPHSLNHTTSFEKLASPRHAAVVQYLPEHAPRQKQLVSQSLQNGRRRAAVSPRRVQLPCSASALVEICSAVLLHLHRQMSLAELHIGYTASSYEQ